MGSAYGIHVVTHYLDDRADGKVLTKKDHEQLIFELIRKIGKPVALAALTTFAGFVSFCFTSVLPIREFGYFSSFGVFASFIVSMTFIPSVLLVRGPRPLSRNRKKSDRPVDGETAFSADPLSDAIADAFTGITRKKRIVVTCSIALILFSCYSIPKLIIDNVLVEYFRGDADVSQSDQFIRDRFAGTKTLSVVVRSDEPLGVLHPDVLMAMDGLSTYLAENVPEVGKVMGFTDLVKRINQVYNADEDPSGIQPVSPMARSDPGGEDSFGFGDFGVFLADTAEDSTTDSGDDTSDDTAMSFMDGNLTRLDFIASLDEALRRANSGSVSVRELIKELKNSVNFDGGSYYEIPANPVRYGKSSREELATLVSNYLVLLSGDISSYANDPLEPTAIRSSVQMKTVGQIDTDIVVSKIEEYVQAKFPSTVQVTVGGMTFVERSLNRLVVQSQLISVIISIVMVFLILSLSWRSIQAGFIGIAPLAISILLNFAVMAATGIKLNIGTALVASLAVGIGIDYTIHYLAAYNREYVAHGGASGFLRRTFVTSGKAIMINAISVGCGFAVLMLSKFNMLAQFGFLIALTIFSSSVVALTVLPVLLNWIQPEFIKKEE
ncbi:MAG: MMPL family protein [Spirochaetes bacterium ADurb.Bin215]|nr:MAG: MMPL family protein [Spirochaetes bacterium ADurb.Bin215]